MHFLVIPAYESDEKLVKLVKEAYDLHIFEIITVDDGSKDRYPFGEIESMAVVLIHPENRGKGAALKTAFKYIKDSKNKGVIVTADADGQHSLKDICAVADCADKNRQNLITGVRRFSGKVPLKSRLGNIVTGKVFALFSGVEVSDTQCGLRAFHTDRLDKMLALKGDRYEYEMNMLSSAAATGISEVEIETIYIDNNASSHFDMIRDSILIYRELLRFLLSSLTSFLTDYLLYALLLILYARLPAVSRMLSANITARVISAGINYQVNKNMVFRKESKGSFIKYVTLATGILTANNALMLGLRALGFDNLLLAKLAVEIILFIVSYTVQKRFVFYKRYEVTDENI